MKFFLEDWKMKDSVPKLNYQQMSDIDETHDNQNISTTEIEQLRNAIALTSTELIELTYHEQKFNAKLQELNHEAALCIEDERYSKAGVYLNEAQKILEYAAGCGKTIERWLITTVLNNQACLLQRTSYFEQSANYLQAILFNINDFLEGAPSPTLSPALLSPHSQQFADFATFLERKLALALYHLRFCALTSHSKQNEIALKSARTALALLKDLSADEYRFQVFHQRQGGPAIESLKSQERQHMGLLKQLSRIKPIESFIDEQFEQHLAKALQCVKSYSKHCESSNESQLQDVFEAYSIGNLMQAEVMEIKLKPNYHEFIEKEFSVKGKMLRVVHISMAFFTIATELRLISASKYALNDDERKSSAEYKQSKINHLLSIILLARFLPVRSVFYDHTITSFKNHYGLNLKELALALNQNSHIHKPISIIKTSTPPSNEKSLISSVNKTMQIHQSKETNAIVSQNVINQAENQTKPLDPMTDIQNRNLEAKKLKQVKSKSKIMKMPTSESTKTIESEKIPHLHLSKNNENKSKGKTLSKAKETIRSRAKNTKNEDSDEQRRAIYYGMTSKSRSKSKKDVIIERKNSKKGLLTIKSGLLQNKKVKNQAKIEEEYGVKSMGGFNHNVISSQVKKSKGLRSSQAEEECQYLIKFNKMGNVEQINMRKIKSPRNLKKQTSRRKTLSKDKCHL